MWGGTKGDGGVWRGGKDVLIPNGCLPHTSSYFICSLFWGHNSSSRPSAGLSGYANMALLAASLAEAAGGHELDDVLALDIVSRDL